MTLGLELTSFNRERPTRSFRLFLKVPSVFLNKLTIFDEDRENSRWHWRWQWQ